MLSDSKDFRVETEPLYAWPLSTMLSNVTLRNFVLGERIRATAFPRYSFCKTFLKRKDLR